MYNMNKIGYATMTAQTENMQLEFNKDFKNDLEKINEDNIHYLSSLINLKKLEIKVEKIEKKFLVDNKIDWDKVYKIDKNTAEYDNSLRVEKSPTHRTYDAISDEIKNQIEQQVKNWLDSQNLLERMDFTLSFQDESGEEVDTFKTLINGIHSNITFKKYPVMIQHCANVSHLYFVAQSDDWPTLISSNMCFSISENGCNKKYNRINQLENWSIDQFEKMTENNY